MSDDSKPKTPDQRLLAREIAELIESGSYEIQKIGEQYTVKNKSTFADSFTNFEEVKIYFESLGYQLTKKSSTRAKYRKRDQLPDPTRAADSEVNRPKEQFRIRVEPGLKDEVDTHARSRGMTRQDWVVEAIAEKLTAERDQ